MLVIDQRHAHERILYEQFLTNITVHKASSQQLLFPLELYFSVEEMRLLKELQPVLENTGFVFDAFNLDSIQISGLPILMLESEVSMVLEELISNLQNEIPESSFSQSDSIAKSMAKSLAIKTGTFMTVKEQENIVNSLFACKEPSVSPFQKPTFITLRVEDLDKKFAL
jgi:DNA mismatch repair protein MutL